MTTREKLLAQFDRLMNRAAWYFDAAMGLPAHDLRLTSELLEQKAFRLATMLWNWVDSQDTFEPEDLWNRMSHQEFCEWAFYDPTNVNSLRFTYIQGNGVQS